MQKVWQWVLLVTYLEVTEQIHYQEQLGLSWSFEFDFADLRPSASAGTESL